MSVRYELSEGIWKSVLSNRVDSILPIPTEGDEPHSPKERVWEGAGPQLYAYARYACSHRASQIKQRNTT